MAGMQLPDVAQWSSRVTVALGQNPSAFTGPGTNTYLIGTGHERILLDTGDGRAAYLPVLERALHEADCSIQEIVLTHGHVDHIGGVADILERHGPLKVSKMPWPEVDARYEFEIAPIADEVTIRTEGATLKGVHTPGHAPDHLCFILEEEESCFTGDNVLGIGTTIIPTESGDLSQYLQSLQRLLKRAPKAIYPAHGPMIHDGVAKLKEYIAHRARREEQIMAALRDGCEKIDAMVAIIYAAYPEYLHAAAGQSVGSHLLKLEREGGVERIGPSGDAPTAVRWRLI
jgi:ribonuclease/clavin/mitogillin